MAIIAEGDRLPVTKENVLKALKDLSENEQKLGQSKVPIMSVFQEKITNGWVPESTSELQDILGFVASYQRIAGRYEMLQEVKEMVEALIKLEESK